MTVSFIGWLGGGEQQDIARWLAAH